MTKAVRPVDNGPPAEPPPRAPLRVTRAGVVGSVLLAVVILICVRLGFWQLARLDERRQLNTLVAERIESPALTDATALGDTAGLFYRTATLHGSFDHQRSIVLPGRSLRGVPGVHLLTPLLLDGRGDAVIVNRGWVPSADAATIEVADFATRDTATVHGLLLPFPGAAESLAQRGRRQASEPAFRRVWYTVDESALRAQHPYPLLPATIQELPGDGVQQAGRSSYPTRLEPPPLDEGPHMGYALQWFAFALIGLVGWLALMLRGRTPPRIIVPPALAAIVWAAGTVPVNAQLRPLDPMEWSIFDDDVRLAASAGTAILWDQAATLAGTRGRLHEVGNYTAGFRSGRFAMSLGGTALLRFHDTARYAEPIGAARAPDGSVREDAGRAIAATLVRISEHHWPVDVVVRFGSVIPTTSDDAGLDRDRTDFFALLGARYRRGGLALTMEHGVGINGTVHADYPQSDVWTYNVGLGWGSPRLRGVAALVGHQDGSHRTVRGNEDQREARVGVDIGRMRSFAIRYIIGLAEHSPRSGIAVRGSVLLGPRR